jgi:hypothetical protein
MTATTQNENNAAQNNEGNAAMNEVNAQAGKSEVLSNSSTADMIAVTDQIFKDFKGDSQELQLIVAMHKVNDELSIDRIATLIRGDTALYTPKPRKNAAKGTVAKPSRDNQLKGALLNLLPHYAALDAQADKDIVTVAAEQKLAEKIRVAELGRNLNDKQALAVLRQAKVTSDSKNSGKSEAMLKVAALDEMFFRAIQKLYYLRRIQASDLVFNAKAKTIGYTGLGFIVNEGKAKMFDTFGEYSSTLAELGKDANTWLKQDGITSTKAKGKGANARPTETVTATTPSVAINPVESAGKNSKELGNLYKIAGKDPEKAVQLRKDENAKAFFTQYFAAMFVTDGEVDMTAFQKAVDVAMAKAKIARKVVVIYGTELRQDSKALNTKASVKKSAKKVA